MKFIEKRISNLFGRFHVQWEEKQTPLFVLHFPQLSRILEKRHLIGTRHITSTCRVRLRSMFSILLDRYSQLPCFTNQSFHDGNFEW